MVGAIFASDAVASAVKVTPPVAITATWKFGMIDWGQVALILTVAYTALQIAFLLYDRLGRKAANLAPRKRGIFGRRVV
jgi:hypothetical protein